MRIGQVVVVRCGIVEWKVGRKVSQWKSSDG